VMGDGGREMDGGRDAGFSHPERRQRKQKAHRLTFQSGAAGQGRAAGAKRFQTSRS